MSSQLYFFCFQHSFPKNGLKLLTRDAILKVQGQEKQEPEARSQKSVLGARGDSAVRLSGLVCLPIRAGEDLFST